MIPSTQALDFAAKIVSLLEWPSLQETSVVDRVAHVAKAVQELLDRQTVQIRLPRLTLEHRVLRYLVSVGTPVTTYGIAMTLGMPSPQIQRCLDQHPQLFLDAGPGNLNPTASRWTPRYDEHGNAPAP